MRLCWRRGREAENWRLGWGRARPLCDDDDDIVERERFVRANSSEALDGSIRRAFLNRMLMRESAAMSYDALSSRFAITPQVGSGGFEPELPIWVTVRMRVLHFRAVGIVASKRIIGVSDICLLAGSAPAWLRHIGGR